MCHLHRRTTDPDRSIRHELGDMVRHAQFLVRPDSPTTSEIEGGRAGLSACAADATAAPRRYRRPKFTILRLLLTPVPPSPQAGAIIAIVPTSAQLRLCRAADYADPGVTVLLTGVSGQEVSA